MDLRERRRQVRREQRARVEELAGTMTAPAEPLRWRAGWGGRIAGVLWCALFIWATEPSEAPKGAVALLFASWTSLVAGFVFCRLAMWRVTADRDGVFLRRFFSSVFLSWSVISRVELRKDGMLEFFGPGSAREPMGGFFQPPWLARITRLPGVGGQVADTLTAMAGHEHLRPTAQADPPAAGRAFIWWAVPLATVLYGAPLLLTR
ncbi:hypothetical protein [Streptomyces sp. NPDC018693]|uniref:hypothetical protein n=1 Tax=unclassified Streptomyces TaxID=2593676 RepID=UPI003798E1E4